MSVSAINLREVVVTFNEKLDKKSAETAANYTANRGVTFSNPKLSADGKSVTLFASANLSTTDSTDVTIEKVKSDKDSEVAKTILAVKGSDSVIPTVKSVKALGPNTVVVTYSEPVQDGDNIGAYSVGTTALAGPSTATFVSGSNQREVEIELNQPLSIGKHELFINDGAGYTVGTDNVRDFAGFALQPIKVEFEVVQDLTVPTVVSAEFVDQTSAIVKFNKPVRLAEATDRSANFYWNNTGTEGYTQYSADTSNTVEKIDSTTYKVKFSTTNHFREGKVYFFVTGIIDYNGNTMQVSKTELTSTKLAALEITGVTSPADNQIRVTFNRTVDNTTAATASNYVVKNDKGETQTISGSPVRGGTDNKQVTITLSSNLPAGKYTVEVKNVEDTIGNKLATVTKEVTVTDTTPISSITVAAVNSLDGKDKVLVTFPEAMATTGTNGIGTKARYEYRVKAGAFDDANELWATLPDSASLRVIDNKNVEILFNDTTFNTGDRVQLRVNLIADSSNNITPNKVASSDSYVAIANTSRATIASAAAKIIDTRKIEVTVPRHLQSISANDFLVVPSVDAVIVPASAEYKNNTNGTSTVTLTVGSDLKLAAQTYQVRTNPSAVNNTRDNLGILILNNVTSAVAVNQIAPSVSTVSVARVNDTATGKVRVAFDKSMEIVNAGDFRVKVGENTYTPSAAVVVAGTDSKVWDLTVPQLDNNVAATVTTVTNPQSEDTVGKKLIAVTEAKTVANNQITSVVFSQGEVAGTLQGDEKITITFSTAVDTKSIVANWTGSAAQAVAVTTAANTINLPGIGTVGVANTLGDLGITTQTLSDATYALDGENKVVVTLGATNLASAFPNFGALYTSTLTLAGTLKDKDGNYFNRDVTGLTATRVANTTATFNLGTYNTGEVTVGATNYGVADLLTANTAATLTTANTWVQLGGPTNMEARIIATLPTGVTNLIITPAEDTNVLTVTGTRNEAAEVAATNVVVELRDQANPSVVRTITVPISATGGGSSLNVGTLE